MTYRDALHALSAASEKAVLEVFVRFTSGTVSRDDAVRLIAAAIAKANARAVSLADLAYAANLMLATGAPQPVVGIAPPPGDVSRLSKAADTLLSVENVTLERVARLARVEPLDTATRTYSEAMARSGKVKGWVRDMSADPCQLCKWWWREGRVWPADHPLQHHKGCTCTQKIVRVDHVADTAKTRRTA